MPGKALNGYPFRVETNVNAKVVGPNRKLKQNIDKHNMATANLTEGVVKFLRGEFTESYISGLIPNIGNDFNIADQYIPAYMGIGVAGIGPTTDGRGLALTYASGYAPSYADQGLISEILPMAKPGRALVSKSVRSNGTLSQAASLILSTAYHFEDQAESQTFSLAPTDEPVFKNQKFYLADSLYPGRNISQRIKTITPRTAGWDYYMVTETSEIEGTRATSIITYTRQVKTRSNDTVSETIEVLHVDYNTGILTVLPDEFTFTTGLDITYDPVNFDFIYADGSAATVPFINEAGSLERTYYISELGLFSGDISNDNSKLLARVMLDEDTPMVISEGDYVLIDWQIGVYALDDALYVDDMETATSEESSTLKYITQEEQTTLLWEEITNVDADGNIVEDEVASVATAIYDVRAVDFRDISTNKVYITVDDITNFYKGFTADFSCLTGTLHGTVDNIEYKSITEDNIVTDSYYVLTVIVDNATMYTDNPFMCYTDQAIFDISIECSQTLRAAIPDLPKVTYEYIVEDITEQIPNLDMPDAQKHSSCGLSKMIGRSVDNGICKFRPIYYLLGTDNLPKDSGFTELTKENDMYYTLGKISELYGADIQDIYYWYSIKQIIPTEAQQELIGVPIDYDTSEYRMELIITTDLRTNKRSIVTTLFKYTDERYERVLDNKIIFENIYNPNVQKG